MKKIFFILLISSIVIAAEPAVKKYHLGKQEFAVSEVQPGVWMSVGCKSTCLALQALSKASTKDLPKMPKHGGRNPGAALCKYSAKGKVFIAYDENRNQQSFCRFTDNSYTTSGSFLAVKK